MGGPALAECNNTYRLIECNTKVVRVAKAN